MERTFSVITPTILRPSLIETCESIDRQSYHRWQHIVMVDIPIADIPDEKLTLIDRIKHPNRLIRYCEVAHRNVGNTCKSRAFKYVCGDYLLYLDDDDSYLGEVFEILNGQIKDEVWGVFPIERFGEIFFNFPPRMCHTCSNQFFYKPLYPHPDNDNYCADGELIDLLRERHPYLVINSTPLARVTKQGMGLY